MKPPFTLLFILFSVQFFAQTFIESGGGEFVPNPQQVPCVIPQMRVEIDALIQAQTQLFQAQNEKTERQNPLFVWPVQKAAHAPYPDIWGISNYVDHNPAFPDQLLDYNCGQRTYDLASGYNHMGIDIFLWPFSWDQFHNDYAEIVAAAAGTIFYKHDGEFDQNCTFNNNPWNAVYVQHSDGSIAMYGHMKAGSLTSKNLGETVEPGEYLGIVGSSGSSTGPHLHFEVYDAAANLIDPYAGACNNMNIDSWWADQKNYWEPNINAVLTQDAPPQFNPCPQVEGIYYNDNFEYGDMIYFATYFRNQLIGEMVYFTLTAPSGFTINWNHTFQNVFVASYLWYSQQVNTTLFPEEGTWIFSATYMEQTQSTTFTIGTLSNIDFEKEEVYLYPNPTTGIINVNTNQELQKAIVYELSGKRVSYFTAEELASGILNIENLPGGVYIVQLEHLAGLTYKKVIKR
jgi:murein DD-endopeptidase MepM/ murein hydrolase activator NlpD